MIINDKMKDTLFSFLVNKGMFYRLFRVILFVDEINIIPISIVVGKTSPATLISSGQHRPIASTTNRYANC